MRPASDDLQNVLTGSFSRRLIADVFHGSDRVAQGLDVTAWSLDGDLTSDVKHSGSGTIVYASPDGSSYVPTGLDGVLSPYRAKLLLTLEVSDDTFSETVTLGWFKITSVPSGVDQYFVDPNTGVQLVSASVVQIEFRSLDESVKRRGFRSPEQPPSLLSCYDEMRRISDMTVMETLPDKPLPKAITYEASDGGRLKGVQDIATVLGGVAIPDSSGALVVIPPGGTTSVGSLVVGPNGTVTDVGNSIDTDEVYNCVVGVFEDAARNPINGCVATAPPGPLAVDGDYGENTLYYTNDAINTKAAGDAAVRQVLSQSIGGQTYEVPIQCIINPLVELGDVLAVEGWDRPITGQMIKYSMSDSALMNVTLEVPRSLT